MPKWAALALVLTAVLGACGGTATTTTSAGPVQPGDAVKGAAVYGGTCAGCHSIDLSGVNGLGAALVPNDWIRSVTEGEIVDLLVVGRPAEHPDNQTGVDMPPRGGNPALTDQDLADVAAYLVAQNGA